MTDKPTRPTAEDTPTQAVPHPAKQSGREVAPQTDLRGYKPAGKLLGQKAIITGLDSGIALAFALEGADTAILYNETDEDAEKTRAGQKTQILWALTCCKVLESYSSPTPLTYASQLAPFSIRACDSSSLTVPPTDPACRQNP